MDRFCLALDNYFTNSKIINHCAIKNWNCRNRKISQRARVTCKNKNHMNKFWGEELFKKINIPKLIDDYHHWMEGVDICDQKIAYYHPDLCCQIN